MRFQSNLGHARFNKVNRFNYLCMSIHKQGHCVHLNYKFSVAIISAVVDTSSYTCFFLLLNCGTNIAVRFSVGGMSSP